MFLQRFSGSAALGRRTYYVSSAFSQASRFLRSRPIYSSNWHARFFSRTSRLSALRPYLLADIGEGITECQVVSWAVKEGDTVEQFSLICEVQSDKASVEITSRFDGVVKKLHYEEGGMAKVGSALMDIEVSGEEGAESEQPILVPDADHEVSQSTSSRGSGSPEGSTALLTPQAIDLMEANEDDATSGRSWTSVLATPAVRRLLSENEINITHVQGSGKDGRVLKHDVMKYIEAQRSSPGPAPTQQLPATRAPIIAASAGTQRMPLSPIQSAMFKTMTASLSIPHFLYTHRIDLTALSSIIESCKADQSLASRLRDASGAPIKLTILPFVIKALSMAALRFPIVNSSIETNSSKTEVLLYSSHNFGLAVDTPNGLVVPVIRDVQNQSVLSLAAEISRLARLAKSGKLSPADMAGATLVVSNIGSIGGSVVGPVILSPMTAIVAIGQIEAVPAFETGEDGVEKIVKKKEVVLSWSADHRLLDGATIARCGQEVAAWLERPHWFSFGSR